MSDQPLDAIRRRAAARAERAFRALVLVGVLTLPVMGLGVFFLISAFVHRAAGRALGARGVVVPAVLQRHYLRVGEDMAARLVSRGTLAGMLAVVAQVARLVPAILENYAFTLEGREREVAKYFFADEVPVTNPDGSLSALVDPLHPRLHHWLICR
ncbi:MAG: hypothetical protein HYV09_21495 [Deltaproteobacteria bacterium]|nr:hypothetical protein [Deltaproteobacteria bacterium]